jgi:uncharacterized protein YndB with AHSA1/START domain
MKTPEVPQRPADDATLKRETGRDRREWFALVDASGATGRAAVGKVLQAEKLDPWWITTLLIDYENAKDIREKDGRPKGYSLCMTKTINASVETVYDAFVTGSQLSAWFAPDSRLTAEVGGALESGDGDRATVLKLRPQKAVVLRWDTPELAPATEVEILFQPKDSKCGVVVNHNRVQTRHEADRVRSAWEQALTRLKQHLEG